MKKTLLIFTVLTLIMSITIRTAEPEKPDKAKLISLYKTLLENTIKEGKIAGIAGALIINGKIVWKAGNGYASKEKKLPFTTSTSICIGSVSKFFTALGILQLHEKRQLDINQPLVKYLPAFSIKTRNSSVSDISISNVLYHNSGIPNDITAGNNSEKYTDTVKYLKDEYTTFPPGTMYHYSNVGYCLLGHAIHEVSGENYQDYMKKNILEISGMKSSGFRKYHKLQNECTTYDKDGSPRSIDAGRNIPAGGICSNIDDMAAFALELINIYHGKQNGFIKPDTLKKAFKTDENVQLKLQKDCPGGTLYSKGSSFGATYIGSHIVSNAGMLIVPEKKAALVLVNNSAGGLDLIWQAFMKLLKTYGINPYNRFHRQLPSENQKTERNYSLNRLTGMYVSNRSVSRVEKFKNGLLYKARENYRLIPQGKNTFSVAKEVSSGKFEVQKKQEISFGKINGEMIIFWNNSGYKYPLAHKLDKQIITSIWKKRLGTYLVQNQMLDGYDIFNKVELSISRHNLLQLKIKYRSGEYKYLMRIANSNELIFNGLFSETSNETVQFGFGKNCNVMRLSGLKLKQLNNQ